ncbi:MAG: hypothetical protein U9O97_05530, partial [Elusimicrobiota bacterium]|nr:hypothetical protein [Elusimicrobiota bacterium]
MKNFKIILKSCALSFVLLLLAAPTYAANDHLVITKVYVNGAIRWIEIFNPTAGTLTLGEIDLWDAASGEKITCTDINVSMASGDYYI